MVIPSLQRFFCRCICGIRRDVLLAVSPVSAGGARWRPLLGAAAALGARRGRAGRVAFFRGWATRALLSFVELHFPREGLGLSFPLRCVQRLSFPHLATRRYPWQRVQLNVPSQVQGGPQVTISAPHPLTCCRLHAATACPCFFPSFQPPTLTPYHSLPKPPQRQPPARSLLPARCSCIPSGA